MGYKNEAAFSRALTESLRRQKWFVQRIESGTTGRGIPDIYAISPDNIAMWLELKVIPGKQALEFVIPWRPGQQAWMLEVGKRGQTCFTLVAYKDAGYITCISISKPCVKNIINLSGPGVWASTALTLKDVGSHLRWRSV